MRNMTTHTYDVPDALDGDHTVAVLEFDMVLTHNDVSADVHVSVETLGCHQTITFAYVDAPDVFVVNSTDEHDGTTLFDYELYANVTLEFAARNLA